MRPQTPGSIMLIVMWYAGMGLDGLAVAVITLWILETAEAALVARKKRRNHESATNA